MGVASLRLAQITLRNRRNAHMIYFAPCALVAEGMRSDDGMDVTNAIPSRERESNIER